MTLDGKQIIGLANVINDNWDHQGFSIFTKAYLNYNLANEIPKGSLFERVFGCISYMNGCHPPRDKEFLELLHQYGPNSLIKDTAGKFLKPVGYYSPTDDAHDAILVGEYAFVNRTDLRQCLRNFSEPTPYSTHVLVVRGDQPCGKSYSWCFIQHLASVAGATLHLVKLSKVGDVTPAKLLTNIAALLDLGIVFEEPKDNPQLSQTIYNLFFTFKGKLHKLKVPFWLVIDEINHAEVTPAMRETVYALAECAEECRMNLWVILLGYNAPIIGEELKKIAHEIAEFPDVKSVAKHFVMVSNFGPTPIGDTAASQKANSIFSKYSPLNKENMMQIEAEIEREGKMLIEGIAT